MFFLSYGLKFDWKIKCIKMEGEIFSHDIFYISYKETDGPCWKRCTNAVFGI